MINGNHSSLFQISLKFIPYASWTFWVFNCYTWYKSPHISEISGKSDSDWFFCFPLVSFGCERLRSSQYLRSCTWYCTSAYLIYPGTVNFLLNKTVSSSLWLKAFKEGIAFNNQPSISVDPPSFLAQQTKLLELFFQYSGVFLSPTLT